MEPVEWTATAGGQVDDDSHGDVNLGVRSGAWSAVLRTDAPELTWSPSGERGRSWIGLRGHGFAAQMFISPWTNGAPDPTRAYAAASAGLEAGTVRYGPLGTYYGGRIAADGIWSFPNGGATDVPGPRYVGTADAILGLWRPSLSAWARGGVDAELAEGTVVSPHLSLQAHWTPEITVSGVVLGPRVEAWGGVAESQDELLRTRLGGLNPWVVPLAGAAWAEWWVEDYGVARLGGTIGVGEGGAKQLGLRVSPFVDLAGFDDQGAYGVGLGLRAWRGRLFVDATGGLAPEIPRQPGYHAMSVWFSLGWDWGTLAGPADDDPPGPPGTDWP